MDWRAFEEQQNNELEEKFKDMINFIEGQTGVSERENLKTFLHQERLKTLEWVKSNLPKVITPTIEPPPNRLSQNQIFAGGQTNMAIRIIELLDQAIKENE